ncbi:LytTR family transcriptional regulator [Methylorubrum populi]|uniref:LytTR family transcriptional regulator n=1 Tax=Methylobacterium radiotolerans TaxID=31998 RepID=A0ABU7T6X9_9HYPH
MFGVPLTFAAPLALAALVALPALWILLRVTPPRPRRIHFPPLALVADLLPKRETPARTPPWLLILRILAAACLILAVAGPVWNPGGIGAAAGREPLLLILDNGFVAAHDWRDRLRAATDEIEAAARDGRPVALVASADAPAPFEAKAPATALERLRAIQPRPHLGDRGAHLASIGTFLERTSGASIVWISDGVRGAGEADFAKTLGELAGRNGSAVTVLKAERSPALALEGSPMQPGEKLSAQVLRAQGNGRDTGLVRALDQKGLPLAESRFTLEPEARETSVSFDLPVELRNAIARLEIEGERSAGAVVLMDERGKRRRVGLVFGGTLDQAQPLLAPTYYLAKALNPFADVQQPRGGQGTAESIGQMLDNQVSVLALADVGALDERTLARVQKFVDEGGLLLRFAGPRLAAGNDPLVPVRLRRGGRSLGGTLSWDRPKTLAAFAPESPFAGLNPPADIGVRRQILAEPDGDLPGKTWASLQDGTPIVTAEKRGQGLVVLFHVTADTTWSNLPLSGLFVDMLRRVVGLAGPSAKLGEGDGRQAKAALLAPRLTLDGFGALGSPPASATAVPADFTDRAGPEHPPGFYGTAEGGIAVNALVPGDRLEALDLAALQGARMGSLAGAETLDLRALLFSLALALLALDTLAGLWLGGFLRGSAKASRGRAAPAALLLPALLGFALLIAPIPAQAQEPPANRPNGIESALATRLAFVVTGDAAVDAASRAGLSGLSQMLAARTALEPGEPAGLNLEKDELAFYPLIYWPIVAGRPQPSEAAIRKIDAFMRNGGTVIFDTRDGQTARAGGPPTPETAYLRKMLGTLEVPELEPVPQDHVLTKAFYLVDSFPGRYGTGQTWVETIPPAGEGGERRPARAGDGVTPIIITGNDLAAAWALGRNGEPLYPVSGGDQRQREMAFRGGINIVIYTLTGNYKADQVHVPALLERLGQ